MAYASNSFGGGCPPTYLVSAISSTDMTATFGDLTTWVEVDSTGAKTIQPLGTSGSFCIKLDYGLATEETVKCTSLNPSTGVITFATRGFDGTTAIAHPAGSAAKLNVFPTDTATDWVNIQATATTAQTTANTGVTNAATAQSTANAATPKTTTISTTAPLAGGGDLSTNRTLSIADATTLVKGAVQLTDSTSSTSTTTSATPNSVKTAYDLANAATPKTRLISTTAPLAGGGDLTADRTLSIADGTTTVKGAVQLTDSTSSTSTTTAATPNSVKTAYDLATGKVSSVTAANSSITVAGTATAPTVAITAAGPGAGSLGTTTAQTPQLTLDAYGGVASFTNATIDDTTKLAKSGGTMAGTITMGSNRITGLPTPGASTDPIVASQSMGTPNLSIHTNSLSFKAWNADVANSPNFTGQTASITSGVHHMTAISIPYAMTLTQFNIWQTTGAIAGTSGAFYGLGIYSTTGTLLASTNNQVSSGFIGFTGALAWALSSTYTIQPGNYMIGFLWYSGTGGTPVSPVLGKPSGAPIAQLNANVPTPSSGKLDQRTCTVGTGQTALYTSTAGLTPTASNTNFWVAVL